MALCLISCLSGLCVFICVFCFVLFFLESAVWPSDLKRILNCQFNLPKTGGAWKPGPHWHTANLIQIDFGFKSKKVKKLLWVSPSCPQNKGLCFAAIEKHMTWACWALISAASVWSSTHMGLASPHCSSTPHAGLTEIRSPDQAQQLPPHIPLMLSQTLSSDTLILTSDVPFSLLFRQLNSWVSPDDLWLALQL